MKQPITEEDMTIFHAICDLHPELAEHNYVTHGMILAGLTGRWLSGARPHQREKYLEWFAKSVRDWLIKVGDV